MSIDGGGPLPPGATRELADSTEEWCKVPALLHRMLVGKTGTVIGWRMSDASLANCCKSLSGMWFSTELLGEVPVLSPDAWRA